MTNKIIFTLCLSFGLTASGVAGDKEPFEFGVKTGWNLKKSVSIAHPGQMDLGFFVNYGFSKKISLEMELEQQRLPNTGSGCTHDNQICFFEASQKREWSTRFTLMYHFSKNIQTIAPYFGLGAGTYYIQDSQAKIKAAKKDVNEANVEFEMRRSYKRPGLFGAMGFHLKPTKRALLFVQARCSILFARDTEDNIAYDKISSFSDWFNISAGFRFNFR